MKRLVTIITLIFCTLLNYPLSILAGEPIVSSQKGRSVPNEQIKINDLTINKAEEEWEVCFSIDLSEVTLGADREMILTPVFSSGDKVLELSPVAVNGSRRHILSQRDSDLREKYLQEIKRLNGKKQTVEYKAKVPYRKWMNEAELSLTAWTCGCGGEKESESLLALYTPEQQIVKEWALPEIAYIYPEAEEIKSRSIEGSAFLDFKVGRTEIEPAYRRNPSELEKIRKTIDEVRNDPNLSVTAILIHGYASPEGKYESNARLAEKRAQALKDYVNNLYHFESSLFTVRSTAEDWDGLRRQVDASSILNKNEILAVVDSDLNPDAKEQALKRIAGGEAFGVLAKDFFPSLRHSDYEVSYIVRGFDVNEAKSLIHKNPGQLSLHELFLVSQTYPVGSDAFNEVFDIAVRLYPDDQTANLNAASIALNRKDWKSAYRYLDRSDSTCPETLNNLGVLAEGEGRMDDAKAFYEKAAEKGLKEAKNNLERF